MNDSTPYSGWNDSTAYSGWNECWPYNDLTAPYHLFYVQTIPGSYRPLPQYGWICPRCEKVNAPDVRQCDCKPGDKATVSESDMPTVTTTVWPDRGKVVWTTLGGEEAAEEVAP